MSVDDLCSDCGSTPVHPDDGWKCRRCAERGGDTWSFRMTIDRDKIRAKFGEAMLEALEDCQVTW